MSCTLVVAFLCLKSVTQVEVTPRHSVQWAVAQVEGSVVRVMLRTDAFNQLDRGRMERACSGAFCLSYHKHCGNSEGRLQCVYSFMREYDLYGLTVEVSAADRQALSRAENEIDILVHSGLLLGLVPLSAFHIESQTPSPPIPDPDA